MHVLFDQEGRVHAGPAISVNNYTTDYKLSYFLEAFLPLLPLPAPFVAVFPPLALLLWVTAPVNNPHKHVRTDTLQT
jgi:hypothetical protein